RLRLARLQLHSLEGPQAPDWLIRAALLQVRVELRDFRSGAFAGIAQFERDVRLSVRGNGGSDVEMAVREARIAQAEAKRIQWESFEVLVGESIVDGVVVRGRHVVEARVNRVRQMAAGIIESEESTGDGGAAGLAGIPRAQDRGQMILRPGDSQRPCGHEDEN